MAQVTAIPAELRTQSGKSHRTQLRREGKIPATMYGREVQNTPIQLDERDFMQFLKRHGPSGIVELQLDGDRGAAVIKEVQRHPLTGRVLHLDFQRISMQDRIHAPVPLVLVGEATAVTDEDGVIEQQFSELTVTCRADHLPAQISIDISGLQIGQSIHVSDLTLPEGVETAQSPDTVILSATRSAAGRQAEAAEAEAAEAAQTAEAAPAAAEEAAE
jgi:large subunit ribosomal protein L25